MSLDPTTPGDGHLALEASKVRLFALLQREAADAAAVHPNQAASALHPQRPFLLIVLLGTTSLALHDEVRVALLVVLFYVFVCSGFLALGCGSVDIH